MPRINSNFLFLYCQPFGRADSVKYKIWDAQRGEGGCRHLIVIDDGGREWMQRRQVLPKGQNGFAGFCWRLFSIIGSDKHTAKWWGRPLAITKTTARPVAAGGWRLVRWVKFLIFLYFYVLLTAWMMGQGALPPFAESSMFLFVVKQCRTSQTNKIIPNPICTQCDLFLVPPSVLWASSWQKAIGLYSLY